MAGDKQEGNSSSRTTGVLLRSKDAILKRWRRFFDTHLNSKSPTRNPDVVEQVT